MRAGRMLAGPEKLPETALNTDGSVAECASSRMCVCGSLRRFGEALDEVPNVPIPPPQLCRMRTGRLSGAGTHSVKK